MEGNHLTHQDKLIAMYNESETNLCFMDWLIEKSEIDHQKAIQMAGDLGQAFSKLSDLQARNNELSEALENRVLNKELIEKVKQ